MSSRAAVAVVAVITGLVVLGLGRRRLGWGLALTLVALVLSNGSVPWLKHDFLTARWVALFALAALLLPTARRSLRDLIRLGVPVVALLAVALISSAWSIDPKLTIERAVSFGVLLWVAVALAIRLRDQRELSDTVDALAAASILVLVVSLLLIAFSARGELGTVPRGIFENPNGLGIFLGLTLPFVLAMVERRFRPAVTIPVIAVYAVVVLLTQARGGFLALAAGVLIYQLAVRHRRRWIVPLLLVVLAAGAVVVARPLIENSNAAGYPTSTLDRITGSRSEAWKAAVTLIGDRPFAGYGFGTGDQVFGRTHVNLQFFEGSNPNNAYLQTVLELGLVGAVFVLMPLALAAWRGVTLIKSRSLGPPAAGVIAVLGAGLLSGVVESVFTSAGAPWELLLWSAAFLTIRTLEPLATEFPQRKYAPLRPAQVLVPALGVAIVGAGVAAAEQLLFPSPTARQVARDLVHAHCPNGQCRIAQLTSLAPGYWWLRLDGQTRYCFVIQPSSYSGGRRPKGVQGATCRPLPLKRQHVLTVAVPAGDGGAYLKPPLSAPGGYEPAIVDALARRLHIGLVQWARAGTPAARSADLTVHVFVPSARVPPGSFPYRTFRRILLVRAGSEATHVRTLSAARQFRIGAIAPSAVPHVQRALSEVLGGSARLSIYGSFDSGENALLDGNIDILLMQDSSVEGFLRVHNNVKMIASLPPNAQYVIRFPSGSGLAPVATHTLQSMASSGALQKLEPPAIAAGVAPPPQIS